MTGISGVVLAGPDLATDSGVDGEIGFLVDKPMAIAGILVGAFIVKSCRDER